MNFWAYMDARHARRLALRQARPGLFERLVPNDFRGWLAFGLFIQSSMLFGLLTLKDKLAENQGFMTLAVAVIVTGWVGGAVAFAYSAGKGNAEQRDLANRALGVAEQATRNAGDVSGSAPRRR